MEPEERDGIGNETSITRRMPAGVGVFQRIKPHIRIAMIIQRIAGFRHDRVRREEVTQRRVVPAGVVKIQPQRRLLPLPGEANARRRRPRREASGTEGPVAHLARFHRPAEGDRRAAEVVAQQPVERPVAAQGDAVTIVRSLLNWQLIFLGSKSPSSLEKYMRYIFP